MKAFALLEYYLYLTATTRSNLSLPDAPAGVEVFFDLFTKSQILMIGFILGRFTDIPTRVLVKEDRTHTHTHTHLPAEALAKEGACYLYLCNKNLHHFSDAAYYG